MRLPSFSAIGRAHRCRASAILPRAQGQPGPAAERGTRIHDAVAKALLTGADEALGISLTGLRRYLIGEKQRVTISCEAAYAYDPDTDTSRSLGFNISREYESFGADMSEQFCGALDYEVVYDDGSLLVVDLKTGRGDLDDWQLKAQAVAAARYHQASQVTVAFARLLDDDSIQIEQEQTFDQLDLDWIGFELRMLKASLKSGVLQYSPGSACQWCRSIPWCEAQTNLSRAMGAGTALAVVPAGELTPALAADAWTKLVAAESLLRRVRAELEVYAMQTPIVLPNGAEVRPIESKRDAVEDVEAIADVVRERYGEEAADAIIYPATTKTKIVEILKARGASKADCDDVMREAKARGGFVESVSTRVDEVRPRKMKSVA